MSDTEGTTPALDLERLRELLAGASESAPWGVDRLNNGKYVVFGGSEAFSVGTIWSLVDAELIAALRNAAPALLSAVASLTQDRDEARDLAVRRANAYLDAVHDRNAAREQAEQVQAELDSVTRERDRARVTVAAAYQFANEMADYCSPFGVSSRYAQDLRAALNRAAHAELATSVPLPVCGRGCTTVCATPGTCPLDAPQPKDAEPATAGGTASSEPCCRCEYEDGDGIDCPVHPDPEPVEASSEQGRTCRECGHTADDHHPAEGSIKPIGCQRLGCECSFTLLGEASHG